MNRRHIGMGLGWALAAALAGMAPINAPAQAGMNALNGESVNQQAPSPSKNAERITKAHRLGGGGRGWKKYRYRSGIGWSVAHGKRMARKARNRSRHKMHR